LNVFELTGAKIGLLKQCGHAKDAAQGCADLMVQGREEVVFDPI